MTYFSDVLREWVQAAHDDYNDVNVFLDDEKHAYDDEEYVKDWVTER